MVRQIIDKKQPSELIYVSGFALRADPPEKKTLQPLQTFYTIGYL